ncbi:MAG: guanylate kinase [Candidatus Dadabacteria bacterium]
MREGIIFIVSGPSGSGKTTLTKRVTRVIDNLRFSVSYTTRRPRPGEIDGVDYRFISKEQFENMVQNGRFVEWATVHGNLYGTPTEELERAKSSGVDLILDIDVQGARSIKDRYGSGVYIFITPSSVGALKDRLVERKEGMADITKRLENARKEIEEIRLYDYIIINNSIDEAVENLASVIRAERCKRERIIESLKDGFWNDR